VTSIDFYVQAADKHEVVRRLCHKAIASKARLMLWAHDHATCQRLSRLIWSTPSTGFIPHCSANDPLAAVTPIILDFENGPFPHDDVLINLRTEVPPFFSRFQRLIEIVSATDEDDKREARTRFRHYRDRGYEIRTHDLATA
jgi:DNA polymerase-3 subunit chi